ncbi:hypothetical protein ACHAWF_011528, partial [Thalassiosira exigua]
SSSSSSSLLPPSAGDEEGPVAPPLLPRAAVPTAPDRRRGLLRDPAPLDGTYRNVDPGAGGPLHQSSSHDRLSTSYGGDVSSRAIEFALENRREDGRDALVAAMGIHVRIDGGGGEGGGGEGGDGGAEEAKCRVTIHARRAAAAGGEGAGAGAWEGEGEGAKYVEALDAVVPCRGGGSRTLLSTDLFLRAFRRWQEDARQARGGAGRGRRVLQGQGGGGLTYTDAEGDEGGAVLGDDHANEGEAEADATAADAVAVEEEEEEEEGKGGGLSEEERGYPFLIPPGFATSFYVAVSSPDDAPEDGPSFSLLSSRSPNAGAGGGEAPEAPDGAGALYLTDASLRLYEGSSVVSGSLVDDPDDVGVERPTVFDGAVFYDLLDGDETSLLERHDEASYKLLQDVGCRDVLETGYVDTIGSFGFMLDVSNAAAPVDMDDPSETEAAAFPSRFRDLEVTGMDLYVRNLVDVRVEVHVRNDGGPGYVSYAAPRGQTSIDDNWRLVAEGTVAGRGPGVGSPIPDAAWKRNVVVTPGQKVGLYVTVHGAPDLRYRNTTKEEGEVQASDGTLNVHVGRAWGEHPLLGDGSDVYFAPREFAGAFRYKTQEGLCRSEVPSAAPSFPSDTPAPSASGAPTPLSRNSYAGADYEDLCPGEGELETTFEDGTGSYGALFDVLAKERVTLTGIDFNIDWNSGDEAEVLIYARQGSWFGHQNNAEAWPYLLVNTTLYRPDDFHNRSSDGAYVPIEHKRASAIVPRSAFAPLPMKAGETWSLYACASLPDFRYQMGTSIGKTSASSPELRVMEGAGAADWPQFQGGPPNVEYTFYAPRVFSGNLRYDYASECASEVPSAAPTSEPRSEAPSSVPVLTTHVNYTFYVEHASDRLAGAVIYDMSFGVRAVLDRFTKGEEELLHWHAKNDGLEIATVEARSVSPTVIGYLCYPTPPDTCTSISVDVTAMHRATASVEDITYALLSQSKLLPTQIDVEGYKM